VGIIKKVKGAISSKANSALDAVIDPAKEIEIIISDLETQRAVAIKELLSYKSSAKQMEQAAEEEAKRAQTWEKRAMLAVKKGDDDTAKECLRRKREADIELVKIRRDQSEAATYAAELNRSRKLVETRLRMLKLKKGTMATQIAAARSGTGNVLGQNDELFDKLDEAERKIDEEVFEQEAAAELAGEREANQALEAELLKAGRQAPVVESPDDPLVQLKAKMEQDKKLLKD
jgi:phage shock protein A